MRDHVRELIHRARQGTDAGRVRGSEEANRIGIEALAADAVRLARIAAAVHAAQAARRLAHEPTPGFDALMEMTATGEPTR